MNRASKIIVAASAAVIAGLVALAVPAIAALPDTLAPDPAATAETAPAPKHQLAAAPVSSSGPALQTINGHTFSAEGPGNCTTNAAIHPYGTADPRAKLLGELTDMGETEFASGDVRFTPDGLIDSYTVVPGDSLIGIGERFCIDYVTVGAYNDRLGSNAIQPGDTLVLRPNS